MTKTKRQSSIWRKAKYMHFSSYVKSSGEGQEKQYFDIKDEEGKVDYIVTLKHTRQSIEMECTCLNKTFNVIVPNICSHMIVVILHQVASVKLK